MVEFLTLNGSIRKDLGSSNTNRLRKEGYTPAVIYGTKGDDNLFISIAKKDFDKEYLKGNIEIKPIELTVDGKLSQTLTTQDQLQISTSTDKDPNLQGEYVGGVLIKMPQLSIITVNYNNNPGLLLTLDSIKKQQFTDYEHIIIDAASTDGSLDTILEYAKGNPHLTYWVSEPDKGIYDGMNKGIDHASGEYLLFMNSGDFLDGDVLYKIPLGGAEYIYGDVKVTLASGDNVYIASPDTIDLIFIILKDTICHQVCFIHRSLFAERRYRTDYILASDWIHIVENIVFKGCTYRHIPICIAVHDGNGISATSGNLGKEERMRWIRENIPEMFYNSLVELEGYRESVLSPIIPLIKHTRRFQYRISKLIMLLYKINELFSVRTGHKR